MNSLLRKIGIIGIVVGKISAAHQRMQCDRRSGRVRSLKPLRLRHDLIFGNAPPLRLWFRLVTVLGVWEGEFRLK